jgi:hypothetical protein
MKKFLKKISSIPFYCVAITNMGPNAMKDPNSWIKYSDSQMRGNSSESKITMSVESENWQRSMDLTAKVDGRDKAIVFIENPPKDKGVGTLRLEMKMWNYFPKTKRTIAISPEMLLASWMGSDFSNDDLLKASSIVDDYEHKFGKDETVNGIKYKIIENHQKNEAKVIWKKIVYYVDQKDCLPRYEKFYNKDNELIRTLTLEEIKTMGGHLIPTKWTMKYEKESTKKTVLTYKEVKFDLNFNKNEFTMQNLTK